VEYELPPAGDSTATVAGQERQDALTGGESRVETSSVAMDALHEQPDFKIEHAQPHEEDPAAVMVSPGDAAPTAEETPEESSSEEPAGAVQGEEEPAPRSDEPDGFAFLSGGGGASPPAEASPWPSPDTATGADDAPDDDKLNDFFKGLK
jgi:hypothetical protein